MSNLGHTIRPEKLAENNRNCESISKYLLSTNQTEVQLFVEMCDVYRRFVCRFSQAAASLNVRTGKNQPVEFGLNVVELDTFQKLKEPLMSSSILVLPRHGQWYILNTDACDYQIERALLQQQLNKAKLPAEYWNRTLSAPVKSYSTTKKLCLAVLWSTLTL